ncbi:MAG: hypothetical protein ACU84Q_16945 [Gammaproteobacteria bacterium]
MLSTKITTEKTTVFDHPDLGRIPAKVLLDCVFALTSEGKILHYHSEQLSADESGQEILFSLSGEPADESRSRCQIIPPRVPEFPKLND